MTLTMMLRRAKPYFSNEDYHKALFQLTIIEILMGYTQPLNKKTPQQPLNLAAK